MEQTTIGSEKMLQATIEAVEKDKNKFTFDGKGKEDAVETLNRFLKDCNTKDYGRKITVSEIIARGLRKLDLKDVTLLQEQSMGLGDSMRQKYKAEKGIEATENEFVRWLMEECSQRPKKKNIQ